MKSREEKGKGKGKGRGRKKGNIPPTPFPIFPFGTFLLPLFIPGLPSPEVNKDGKG